MTYTFKTRDIRDCFMESPYNDVVEFDRWLSAHDAEVAVEAYKRGYKDGHDIATMDWP